MARKADTPCAACGKLIWRGRGSLPAGQARCRQCRRLESGITHVCGWCGANFVSGRTASKYCSLKCSGQANGARRVIRALDDPRVQHGRRLDAAPGLRRTEIRALLVAWRRQCRACVYCSRRADTVDHVVPLVRGGTNFEGNLAPACRSCNSAKGGLTVVEWRSGLRLSRVAVAA